MRADDRRRLASWSGLGTVAVTLAMTLPAEAGVAGALQVPLPNVGVPQAPLPQTPSLPPTPALPAPPSLPSAPSLPPAPSVQAPATPSLPSAPSAPSAPSVGSVGTTIQSGRQAPLDTGVPAPTGTPGPEAGTEHPANRKAARTRGIHGTRYRTRRGLVHGLDGCVDNLPPMQRAVLVLRYGIGPGQPRSRARTARALGVSRTRVGVLERRGVRSLGRASRRTGCEHTGVARSTMFGIARLVSADSRTFLMALTGIGGPSGGLAKDIIGVKGVSRSGSEDGPGLDLETDGGDDSIATTLAKPFGDLDGSPGPLLLALLAGILLSLGVVAREIVRAVR